MTKYSWHVASLLSVAACTFDLEPNDHPNDATGLNNAADGSYGDGSLWEEPDAELQVSAEAAALDSALLASTEAGLPPANSDAAFLPASSDAASLDASNQKPADAGTSPEDAGNEEQDRRVTYPSLLSQTGLYQSVQWDVTKAGVHAFEPRYALWSDGAAKRRWFSLPPGTQIDTSDMDGWRFPVGTKAWKEFRSQGVRVETRMLHKVAKDRWVMISYRWRPDQTDAEAVPHGEENALGTNHDIPAQTLCVRCHGNTPDALLSVSALQLSHDAGGTNLDRLRQANLLSVPGSGSFQIPGGPIAEQALGYLHANCGHCHHPTSPVFQRILMRPPNTGGPILWERTDELDTLKRTVGYASTVNRPNSVLPDLSIIEPGNAENSELFIRMSQRGAGSLQMPPIATEQVDQEGLRIVREFIESLGPKWPFKHR